MGPGRWLAALAVTALVVVAGASAGTGALWRSRVPLDGGTVRSGSLVLLTGDATTQTKAYAFGSLAGGPLGPGAYAQAPLTISNGGTVPLGYRLASASTSGATTLAAQLRLSLRVVPDATGCPTGVGAAAPATSVALYDGALVGASTMTRRPVAVGAREVLCVRVSVASTAPATVQGLSAGTVLGFAAEVAA